MVRDKDSFECLVCQASIESWNVSRFPMFKLVKRPDKAPV